MKKVGSYWLSSTGISVLMMIFTMSQIRPQENQHQKLLYHGLEIYQSRQDL